MTGRRSGGAACCAGSWGWSQLGGNVSEPESADAAAVSKAGEPATAPVNGPPEESGPVTTPAEDAALLERTLFEVKRAIVGQDRISERMSVAVVARDRLHP